MTQVAARDEDLCEFAGFSVMFPTRDGHVVNAVSEVTLAIGPGEALGVVGESGSGKTLLGLAILGLLPAGAIVGGSIEFGGAPVVGASKRRLAALRGRRVGLILQDPTGSLNPVRTIRSQLYEAARLGGLSRKAIAARIRDDLRAVALDPERVLSKYPHQLSGGMNQRVAIAMALIQDPELLVADEPTTALDVSSQSEIIALLNRIRRERRMALVFVSHDLNVVRAVSERIAVVYAGRLVEIGPRDQVLGDPRHPYTIGLIRSTPVVGGDPGASTGIPGQLEMVRDSAPGCPFANRCPRVLDVCRTEFPSATQIGHDHSTWCWAEKGARG